MKLILASGSPRRKQLLEMAHVDFEVISADVDETNPPGMPGEDVPVFLAEKKAAVIAAQHPERWVLAADTIVLLDHEILGKPKDDEDAVSILKKLSGRMHTVVTGVCLQRGNEKHSFSATTEVYFRKLSDEQIRFYVEIYHPMDKAGAYAIQEYIGVSGIEKINGDYYNVMGLPVGEVLIRLGRLRD